MTKSYKSIQRNRNQSPKALIRQRGYPGWSLPLISTYVYISKTTLRITWVISQLIKCHSGWSGGAKVSCILCHRGVQLILAYSWARPAILVASKGREVIFFYFFCFFTFIPVPLSSLSLSFISSAVSSVSFLPFSGRRHKMTHKGWRVVKPQHKSHERRCTWRCIDVNTSSSEKPCASWVMIHMLKYDCNY